KPVTFTAEILKAQATTQTSVSGLVLDQNLRALPNVLVRLGGQQTRTAANGRFTLGNAQSGPHQVLELIGRDQVPFPGRWTNISYDIDVLPGINNRTGKPLYLPRVNAGINLPLNSEGIVTQDTTYELPVVGGQPPVRVTARAGTRVTFPPDVTDKRFSVTRIDADRVPMTLEDGRATNLYISVQPSGAVFEPALEVSFPNLDGLNPNEKSLLMSFDHDAGRYVQVGTARVSADGLTVKSDPGSGIRVGAWHATPPEDPLPEATVLSFVQVEGNPSFENKDVEVTEASVLGARAVPYNEETNSEGILSKILLRGVVSFPRNSAPQTSKVLAYTNAAAGQLQFDNGLFDPQTKEIFLAQDREVELLLSATGLPDSSYTYQLTKTGNSKVVIATLQNNKLTLKGGPSAYDDAGGTEIEVTATGSQNGKAKAKVKVNLVLVKYKEDKINSGFDSLVKGKLQDNSDDPNNSTNKKKDPWLTVVMNGSQTAPAAGGTQTAKYEVTPDKAAQFISFESDNAAKATVTFSATDKKVTVEGVASDGTATSTNETEINAKIDAYKTTGFKLGKLNVVVRRRVKVNAAFFYIRDNSGTNTAMDPDDLNNQITKINQILLPQTGIEYVKLRVYHWEAAREYGFTTPPATRLSVVNRDFHTVVSNAEWDVMTLGDTSAPAQPKLCDAGADREIYFVWDTGMPDETIPNARVASFFDSSDRGTIITDTTTDMEALAHEIGHSFGIRPADLSYRYNKCDAQGNNCVLQREHSNVLRELMFSTTGGRSHIPKADVDHAIQTIGVSGWLSGGKPKRPC
ncbi:MAG TPA: carboxypeptidase-like regulatory domain-containing protein, partial [Pyrinomonadaceae bacterium]